MLAMAAGICYDVTAGLLKVVVAQVQDGGVLAPLAHWSFYAVFLTGPPGFLLSQNAFQQGRMVSSALTVITTVDPVVAIAVGVGWLGERVTTTPVALAGEAVGAVAVVIGVVVLARHGDRADGSMGALTGEERSMVRARIVGVATHLPERQVSSRAVEAAVRRHSNGFVPRAGIIETMTGIRSRHVADDSVQASDLAVAASVKLLADRGIAPADLDLVLFASASQDMVEPATAHIVCAKLGARCPTFDVKNACNSVLNGIQVAEALITTGQYERVLVVTGETPSRAVRWRVRDFTQFAESFPGYTLSDAGAAVLLERAETGGIFHRSFVAESTHWQAGTLPAGGSAHPRDPDFTYYRMDGPALRRAFEALGRAPLDAALAEAGVGWHDFAVICVHQVTMPYLEALIEQTGIPADRVLVTLPEHGNLASANLPFQLSTALQQGRAEPGDRVALLGLAGGVSLGVVFAQL